MAQVEAKEDKQISNYDYDVLIIGGGPAGLSAAMTLGRFLHKVLLCDDNRPRNLKSSHANNLPISDGINPQEWRAKARDNLKKYQTVTIENESKVISIEKNDNNNTFFKAQIETVNSKVVRNLTFRKIILAYGMTDGRPALEIKGFEELWGQSVLHCPFCHGYEVRDKKLGLLVEWAGMADHLAPVLYGLSSDLIIFTNGNEELTLKLKESENCKLYESKGIKIIDNKIESLTYDKNDLTKLNGIVLANNQVIERDALFYGQSVPIKLKSDIGDLLGCKKTHFGHLEVDSKGLTNIDGVYAAGDIISFSSVLQSASQGQEAAGSIVFLLANENFQR